MVDPREIPLSFGKPELVELYRHIGSEKRLKEIISDFYSRMSNDILIGFFFAGKDVEEIAGHQMQFLLRAMGASPTYSGKPPAQAHQNLAPILSGHFDRRLQILENTLLDHGISREDADIWIKFENAFRDGIVQK